MKKLMFDQNKWALTACLLAVLGFNVSFNGESSQKLSGSSDMASKTIDSKFASDDGKTYDIVYIEKEGKVVALVPAAAEGKACSTGECLSSHVLDAKFTDDVKTLESALRKQIKDSSKVSEKEEERKKVDQEDKRKTDEEAIFEAILEKCSTKSEEQILDCKVNGLTKVLRKKDSKISKKGALDFYVAEIERDLIDYMSDAMNYDPITGFDLVSKFQSDINKEYNSLRSRIALDAAQAVRKQAMQVQQQLRQAETYKQQGQWQNAIQANSQATTMLTQHLPTVYNGLDYTMSNSLMQAVQERLMSSQDAYRIMNDMYRNSAQPVFYGITMNPATYQIPQMNMGQLGGMAPQSGLVPQTTILPQPTVSPAPAPQMAPAPTMLAPASAQSGQVQLIRSYRGSITAPGGAVPAQQGSIILQRQ